MIDAALAQATADRQTGVTGADDNGGDVANGRRSPLRARRAQFTSTVTFVGLVMTSKTAERF